MNLLKNISKSFRAEWIKLRRSGVFWLIIGMSAFIPLIFTLITIFGMEANGSTDSNAWLDFIRGCYMGFAGFFFPIYLVLVANRLAQMEHRSAGWKLIETQPMHRAWLFLAKWQIAMILSLICLLGVLVFGLLGATIISFLPNAESFRQSSIPWGPIAALIFRLWISSLGILAIQYFLSIWVANFLFSFGIGLVAIITASIISGFDVAPWFPYSATIYTIRNAEGSQTGSFMLHHEWLSIAWMLLFLWIGYQWYRYKSWKYSFKRPAYKPLAWGMVVLLFALAFWWIEKPVQLSRYPSTAIAGSINATDTITQVTLLRVSTLDTVLTMPATDNKFHYRGSLDLPLDEYLLAAGQHRTNLVFSGKDSIYVDWKWTRTSEDVRITGTRVAENEHNRARNEPNFAEMMLQRFGHQYSPQRYSAEVIKSYERRMKRMNRFTTVDNIMPSDDYKSLMEKLTIFKYLRMLYIDYPRLFAVYNPNDTLKYPPVVDKFRQKVNLSDSTLVNFDQYRQYMVSLFHDQTGIAESRIDSTYFNHVIENTSPGKIRDMLIYEKMKQVLTHIRDSARRNDFVYAYAPEVLDPKLRNSLLDAANRMNRLGRGKPAPEFAGLSLNQKIYTRSNFEGRFVVIDVWASWCEPCKREAPYFEELAEKYSGVDVAFISLSVDQDMNAWRAAAENKSKRILQLWAMNAQTLNQYMAIDYIPRFILLDPRGRILNMQMPLPSDPAFEEELQKEFAGL